MGRAPENNCKHDKDEDCSDGDSSSGVDMEELSCESSSDEDLGPNECEDSEMGSS
jgi:hypothetical protein